jgi:hypothetical protein
VGGQGKYPGAPPHIRKKEGKNKPTARYLIGSSGERGKAIKKKWNFFSACHWQKRFCNQCYHEKVNITGLATKINTLLK